MSGERYFLAGEMLEVVAYEGNTEYAKDLLENPVTEDQDPTDTLDEFIVTVKFTVKDPMALATLRLMAEDKLRFDMATS